MSTTLELNCLILGEGRDHIFSLKILSSECVGTLKEAIKDKNNNTFQHVDADGLELWVVSVAVDDSFEEKINNLELESSKRLLPVRKLSLVFSDQFEDEHLHIVVRPPPAKPPRLELNCLMLGDNFRHIFSVKILSTETISTLREAIKDKKKPTFQHVDARTLVLWQVSIPNDDSPELKLSELDLVDENPLSPMVELWQVFLEPPIKRHVHIVVKPPPALSKFDKLTGGLTFSQLETAQNRVVDGTLNAPTSSFATTVDAFIREQEKRPIWNGRPSTNCGIPIQLYHPSFAKFLHIVRDGTVEVDLRPEDCSATHSLFHTSSMLFRNEFERVKATRVFLDKVIGRPIPTLYVPGMRADGACQVMCGGLYALAALAAVREDECEIGFCDPSHQCALDFRLYYAREEMKPIRGHCCCPTFLIALAGPWMCILGAVFIDHVVVQQLTDFVWIGGDPYNDDKLKSVTRILVSLGTGIAELEEFYDNLKYSVGEHVVRFSYQAYLMPKTPESSSKAMFLATTETGDRRESRREIVVKFVQRYNHKAHRLLATADLAPKLLYCSTEDPNPPDLAGLIMVVMEYVNGTTAHQRYGNERLPQPISDRIEEALGILHANNIVFGDLRHPNVMITKDERVLLIDFDWCGVHEEQTYPVSLNDARNTTNSISWHPGVKRGGRMMDEHDTFMLKRMKPES